ncbi:MAG: prephenate dehydratase [Nitrososphaera sp.]|jgi:prephenate dehydratase
MKTRVAFQGERGAYGEMAALSYFANPELVPLKSFHDVFASVEDGKVAFAVVPVENSIEGSVNEVYDLILDSRKLVATGEVYQRIHHCLIANSGVSFSDVKFAHSHPQALAQCRGYLQRMKIEPVAAYDTAGAVKFVKERNLVDAAAIASRNAAELYGMQILEEGIEDRQNNFTRFLVMCTSENAQKGSASAVPKHSGESSGKFKTSIVFSVSHVPGALYEILGEFSTRGINLTKIESRPTKETPWEYNFYMDIEGKPDDKLVAESLRAISSKTRFVKVVGSYRQAEFNWTA